MDFKSTSRVVSLPRKQTNRHDHNGKNKPSSPSPEIPRRSYGQRRNLSSSFNTLHRHFKLLTFFEGTIMNTNPTFITFLLTAPFCRGSRVRNGLCFAQKNSPNLSERKGLGKDKKFVPKPSLLKHTFDLCCAEREFLLINEGCSSLP